MFNLAQNTYEEAKANHVAAFDLVIALLIAPIIIVVVIISVLSIAT